MYARLTPNFRWFSAEDVVKDAGFSGPWYYLAIITNSV